MTPRPLLFFLCTLLIALIVIAVQWSPLALGPMTHDVLWQLRLPRVGLAVFTGAALALSGLLLQDFFRNDLVEPGLLGVSAGAGLAAVLTIAFGSHYLPQHSTFLALPAAAFIGALSALALILSIGRRLRTNNADLLLVGVALNALTAALINILLSVSDNSTLRSASFWLMGSFSQADWRLLLPAVFLFFGIFFRALRHSTALDIWPLGNAEAAHLGVPIKKFRREILVLSSVLVAFAVAQSGGIGFIGLLAPHIARRLGLAQHRHLLPASVCIGATLAVLADLLARTLMAPLELPVGVLTALIGAPLFLLLFLQKRP